MISLGKRLLISSVIGIAAGTISIPIAAFCHFFSWGTYSVGALSGTIAVVAFKLSFCLATALGRKFIGNKIFQFSLKTLFLSIAVGAALLAINFMQFEYVTTKTWGDLSSDWQLGLPLSHTYLLQDGKYIRSDPIALFVNIIFGLFSMFFCLFIGEDIFSNTKSRRV